MIPLLFQIVVDIFLLSSAEEFRCQIFKCCQCEKQQRVFPGGPGMRTLLSLLRACVCPWLGRKDNPGCGQNQQTNQTNTKKNNSMEEIESIWQRTVTPSAFPKGSETHLPKEFLALSKSLAGLLGGPRPVLSAPGALHSPGRFSGLPVGGSVEDQPGAGGGAGGGEPQPLRMPLLSFRHLFPAPSFAAALFSCRESFFFPSGSPSVLSTGLSSHDHIALSPRSGLAGAQAKPPITFPNWLRCK